MSIAARIWAEKQKAGAPHLKLLLLELANFANASDECWPKLATLSELTEMSEERVRRGLAVLEEKGFISRRSQGKQKIIKVLAAAADRERRDAPLAPRVAAVFVKADTDAWQAWKQHLSERGGAMPAPIHRVIDGVPVEGWFFDTLFPSREATT